MWRPEELFRVLSIWICWNVYWKDSSVEGSPIPQMYTPGKAQDPTVYQLSDEDDLADLFRDFNARETPLYQCQGALDGIKYRIPKVKECKIPKADDALNTSLALEVTLYVEDISIKTIKGQECFAERQQLRSEVGWWGHRYDDELKKEKIYLQATQCRDMASSHRAPNEKKLNRINSGLFGTDDISVPEASWWSSWGGPSYVMRENYFIMQVSIAINRDGTINPTTGIVENCLAKDMECQTVQGVLTWKTHDIKACRIKEFVTTQCIMTPTDDQGIRVSCQDINMSFSKVTLHNLCGTVVGKSQEGMFLTSKHSNEIAFGIQSTTEVKKVMFGVLGARISKRDVGFISKVELSGSFAYYHEVIRDGHNYDILNLHYRICRNSQAIQNNAIYQARSGNPTALVMTYTGDPSYRANLNGDVLSLRRCRQVDLYYFLKREPLDCTLEYPVMYVTKAGDSPTKAWLTPIAHELIPFPTLVECPSPQFYFEMKSKTVLLDKEAVVQSLSDLPYIGEVVDPKLLPAMAFETNNIIMYRHDELGAETIMELQREMNNRYNADKTISNYHKGLDLTDRQKDSALGIQQIALDGFWAEYKGYFIAFGIMMIIVVVAVVHLYFGKVVDGIKSLVEGVGRGLERRGRDHPGWMRSVVSGKKNDEHSAQILEGTIGSKNTNDAETVLELAPKIPPRNYSFVKTSIPLTEYAELRREDTRVHSPDSLYPHSALEKMASNQ